MSILNQLKTLAAAMAIITATTACDTNVIDHTDGSDSGNGNGDNTYSTVTVDNSIDLTQLPEGTDPGDLSVMSLNGVAKPSSSGEITTTMYRGELPQVIFVTNASDQIVFMSRSDFADNSHNTIDARSTALALATMHPSLSGVKSHVYNQLTSLITSSANFTKLVDAVSATVAANGTIESDPNGLLAEALNALLEDVLTSRSDGSDDPALPDLGGQVMPDDTESWSMTSSRAPSRAPELKGVTSIDGIDVGPFHVYTNGLNLVVENYSLTPLYEGTVTHHSEVESFNIPSGGDRGVTFFFDHAWGSEKVEYSFTNRREGEYQFHFDCTTSASILDQLAHTIANLLEVVGLPLSSNNIFKLSTEIGRYAVSQTPGLLSMLVNPSTNAMDIVMAVTTATISYAGTDAFRQFLINQGLKSAIAATTTAILKRVAAAYTIYQAVRGAANAVMRIALRIESPDFVDFCVTYYDGELSTCTEAELEIVGGDNQEGIPGQTLLEPLKVKVTTIGDNGEEVAGSNFHRVEFMPIGDNCGNVTKSVVKADADGYASTNWTLDPTSTETQYVKARVIDIVTNTPISDEVVFEARPTKAADVTFTLRWDRTETRTDIDIHVYDPDGHHICFYNMSCPCGGFLDRDDVHGPGPEHIYFAQAKPGDYAVYVHHYDSESHATIGYTVETVCNDRQYRNVGAVGYNIMNYVGTLRVEGTPGGRRSVKFINLPQTTPRNLDRNLMPAKSR